jgi:Tfp pilus assembly protein PilF
MKRIMTIFIILAAIFTATVTQLFPASDREYAVFNKGVAYIIIGGRDKALKHLNAYFDENTDPALRSAFINLVTDNSWEVTKQFKRYLDLNHRSKTALVGIALSTTDMKVSTSVFNLERAQRLDPGFSIVYLGLGVEYVKQKNYPRAAYYFNRAINTTAVKIPEYKVPLAKLYLLTNEPEKTIGLLKNEADQHSENFYFNYFTAVAYHQMGKIDQMEQYIEAAVETGPNQKDAKLLMAKFLLGKKRYKDARAILKTLRFPDYNEDYYTTLAHVLLKLNDRKAKNTMDLVFSNNRWNKVINRLMGIYYQDNKKEKGNIQNWINRALLSGDDPELIKNEFQGNYKFPEYQPLPFFSVSKLEWITDDLLVVAAAKHSGEGEKLYFIEPEKLRVVNALNYNGTMQDLFMADSRTKFIFSTTAKENESVYLYSVEISGRVFRLRSLSTRPVPMPAVVAGFNKSESLAYITDSRLSKLAVESPFSIVPQLGDRIPVYKAYPFYLYRFNFNTNSFREIKESAGLQTVPIPCVKKYYTVSEASSSKSSIQGLIEQGQKLDLTSSELVKIFFADDIKSFIIYLSDLKDAFQAIVYENENNRTIQLTESMFLGEGKYAELELIDFEPETGKLMVLTKDQNRSLIKFNYKSQMYIQLTAKVNEYVYGKKLNRMLVLTERSKKSHFVETSLEMINLKPYYKKVVDTRRDLEKILFIKGEWEIYFSTFTGELLRMDNEYKFHFLGPSFDGSQYSVSPNMKNTATFINGRLYILEWQDKDKALGLKRFKH